MKSDSSNKEVDSIIYATTHYWGLREVSYEEHKSMTPIQKIYCSTIFLSKKRGASSEDLISEDDINKLSILKSVGIRR